MKPFLKPLYNVYIFLSKSLQGVMLPPTSNHHQPLPPNRHLETRTDQQCLVGILPQRGTASSAKEPWNQRWFWLQIISFDIPQKLLGCRPLCRSRKFFIELIFPTKYFLYGFSYQIMYRSFQKRWNHHAWAFLFPLIPPWSSNRTCSPKTHHNKQPIWKRTNKKNHGGFTWQLGGTWFTFFRGITTI